MPKLNTLCMIPARIGSQRFKKKNLALIGNKSILEMGIDKAVQSNIFDKIIVNGDNQVFKKIADKKGVDFFNREKYLGSSDTKSDDVVYDFICKNECENIIWFNAIAPLQSSEDIIGFTNTLQKKILIHFLLQK